MVNWTKSAKKDIKSISDFISKDSSYYADKVRLEITEKADSIERFPKSGRVVPEIDNDNIREVFIYSYRLIYKLIDSDIYILAVIHASRDITNIEIK